MSTSQSFYQLRRQRSRYAAPSWQVDEWNEWWVSESDATRGWAVAAVALAVVAALLFALFWHACDTAVAVAQQAYGVTL